MGFRYRKSIKLMPGVKMNISNRGIGYSAGVKGARVSRGPSGRVTRTLSVPGTGLSHVSSRGGGRAKAASARPRSAAPRAAPGGAAPVLQAPPAPPRPGRGDPDWQHQLFAAIEELDAGRPAPISAVARAHGARQPGLAVLCAALEGLWNLDNLDTAADEARARSLLAWSVAHGGMDLGAMPYVQTYLSGRVWTVEIATGVEADLTLEQDVAGLAVAELHQGAGDLAAAIWTVEHVDPPTTAAALSLAELYSDAGRHGDVIDITNGISNEDDATALLLVLRGKAFSATGYHDAGRESLKEAMRIRSRSAPVRHRALLERSSINLAQNRKAAARKDLETIMAEDPSFPGLNEAMSSIPA